MPPTTDRLPANCWQAHRQPGRYTARPVSRPASLHPDSDLPPSAILYLVPMPTVQLRVARFCLGSARPDSRATSFHLAVLSNKDQPGWLPEQSTQCKPSTEDCQLPVGLRMERCQHHPKDRLQPGRDRVRCMPTAPYSYTFFNLSYTLHHPRYFFAELRELHTGRKQ